MAAALLALAQTAQDIGASLNKFLDPVDDYSAEITALIGQCFNTSSALRRLSELIGEGPPYPRRYLEIIEDKTLVTDSLDYTFRDVSRIVGGLGRGGLAAASYRRVWRELEDFFLEESNNSLARRLVLYQDVLNGLQDHMIDG